jgi:hypothetical protein
MQPSDRRKRRGLRFVGMVMIMWMGMVVMIVTVIVVMMIVAMGVPMVVMMLIAMMIMMMFFGMLQSLRGNRPFHLLCLASLKVSHGHFGVVVTSAGRTHQTVSNSILLILSS